MILKLAFIYWPKVNLSEKQISKKSCYSISNSQWDEMAK